MKNMKKKKKNFFGTRFDYLVTCQIMFCERGRNIFSIRLATSMNKIRKEIWIKISEMKIRYENIDL